jgi:hypothetical protein
MSDCDKQGYSKKDAQTVLNHRTKGRLTSRHGRPKYLRAYHCEICNAWHLTHHKPRS